MRGKRLLAASLMAVVLSGFCLNVSAAGVMNVFDAEYYAGRYSDLKSAYGTDEAALLNHFMTRGANEGRVMSPILDIVAYRAAYADLNAAFGDDWNAYVNHYLTYGITEKRTSGVLFDLVGYADGNPDVREAYGQDYAAIARHYITYGIKEGRSSKGLLKKAVTAASLSFGDGGSGSGNAVGGADDPAGGISGKGTTGTDSQAPAEHIHSWELTGSLPAGCIEDGYHDYQCRGMVEVRDAAGCVIAILHCTETKREIIKAAHTKPDQTLYIAQEDCTGTGLVKYNCAVCGEAKQEIIPALGHDYDKNGDKPLRSRVSTCREAGYDVFLCKRCGGEIREERIPAEHIVEDWVIDREASCTEEGLRHGRCLVCKSRVTERMRKTSHTNVKNINVYEDAYEENTSVRHSVQNITYCAECGYVIAANTPRYVNCADEGKGMCGACGLAVTREATQAPKVYRAGEFYSCGNSIVDKGRG